MDCPSEIKVFVDKVKRGCESSNFDVILSQDQFIHYGSIKFSGLCDVDKKFIAVATGTSQWKKWASTLVHEYCHFNQFKDQTQIYKNMCGNKFLDWVDNRVNLTPYQIYSHYKDVHRSEFDCELRALKVIEEENLPIDVEEYKISVNIHMYLYSMMKNLRKPFKNSGYSVPEVRECVPHGKLLSLNEYDNIPPDVQNIMLKNCFGG
jgi:hypothetical protein